jgi:hypothetical protein
MFLQIWRILSLARRRGNVPLHPANYDLRTSLFNHDLRLNWERDYRKSLCNSLVECIFSQILVHLLLSRMLNAKMRSVVRFALVLVASMQLSYAVG